MNAEHTPSPSEYKRGCRCDGCRAALGRYQKSLRFDHARGIYRTVDATQVRVHIQRLVALNWTHTQIGLVADVPESTVTSILSRQKRVGVATARAIFEVRLRRCPVTSDGWTDATGSRRRLQALAVIGHSPNALAPLLGLDAGWVYRIADGTATRVSGQTALRLTALYRQLLQRPAPTGHGPVRARKRAAALGWHGPLAWGSDIDDPRCEPEIDDTEPRGIRERVDETEVARLADDGLSDEEIAAELGCHPRTISRARARLRAAEEVAA
ncbi:helix-turn-helix domain-containing protein [Streptomyces sp. NPDC088674]|uniref:helix-turn-helix domain-containing protein n=1 Tax=Streptomyces sp. NPDC088674 TaxID=3365869 RepID=UPI00381F8919